jgi:hypothetical protein
VRLLSTKNRELKEKWKDNRQIGFFAEDIRVMEKGVGYGDQRIE